MKNANLSTTSRAALSELLTFKPAALRGLSFLCRFDFNANFTVAKLEGAFTVAKALKAANAAENAETVVLMPSVHGVFKELYAVRIFSDRSFAVCFDRKPYGSGLETCWNKALFNDMRKKPNAVAYVISQPAELLRGASKPAPVVNESGRYAAKLEYATYPGKGAYISRATLYPLCSDDGIEPYQMRFSLQDAPEVVTDKSGYPVCIRRAKLQRAAKTLRAERQRAAAAELDLSTECAAIRAELESRVNALALELSRAKSAAELEAIAEKLGRYYGQGIIGAAQKLERFEANAAAKKFASPAAMRAELEAIKATLNA